MLEYFELLTEREKAFCDLLFFAGLPRQLLFRSVESIFSVLDIDARLALPYHLGRGVQKLDPKDKIVPLSS